MIIIISLLLLPNLRHGIVSELGAEIHIIASYIATVMDIALFHEIY